MAKISRIVSVVASVVATIATVVAMIPGPWQAPALLVATIASPIAVCALSGSLLLSKPPPVKRPQISNPLSSKVVAK